VFASAHIDRRLRGRKKGVDHGLALAKSLRARVSVVTVIWLVPGHAGMGGWVPSGEEIAAFQAAEKEVAEEMPGAVKSAAEALGITIETAPVAGPVPAEAIIETARARHCDLIVMASHGRRGISRFLPGSQTTEVLVRSPVPVLMVR
jgi:nucleotide-binding universal stress UspA family protein